MTFDAWFTRFFMGMPAVPEHVRWAYQSAYQAGYEQGVTDTEPAAPAPATPVRSLDEVIPLHTHCDHEVGYCVKMDREEYDERASLGDL